tara:strand:+ start:46 stop:252 length:207 start_codon:yes stop_codon:yes gene_type:complete
MGNDMTQATKYSEHEMLLRPEVAHILRVSVVTLSRWATKGIGPEYIRVNGRVLYPQDKLDQWLADRAR